MKSYKERLKDWCEEIQELLQWDIEQEAADYERKGSRSINNTEGLKKAVTKTLSEIDVNYGRGIAMLYDRILQKRNKYSAGFANYLSVGSLSDFDEESIEFRFDMSMMISKLIQLHEEWKENEFNVIIKNSVNSDSVDVDPDILERVNKLVVEGSFNTIKYKDAGDVIYETDQFLFSDKITLSTDLTHYFEHLVKQQEYTEKNPDQIFVTLFGKLDKFDPIFSNWIFTIHKGGSIWLVSDQMLLDNPNQKRSRIQRKSLWDNRRDIESMCDLPYAIFDDLDIIRAKEKGLTNNFSTYPFTFRCGSRDWVEIRKSFTREIDEILLDNKIKYTHVHFENSGNDSFPDINYATIRNKDEVIGNWDSDNGFITILHYPEILNLKFKDIDAGYKTFSLILVNEIVQYLCTKNLEIPVGSISKEFIDQKLIGDARLNPTDNNTRMSYWNEYNQEVFNEIVETAYEGVESCTGLNPISYDVVLSNPKYDNSWLAPTEKLESLSEWLILDQERLKIYSTVKSNLASKKEDGEKWLNKILNKKYKTIIAKLTCEVDLNTEGFGGAGFNSTPRKDTQRCGWLSYYTGKRENKGLGAGKTEWCADWCGVCGEDTGINGKLIAKFNYRHYKALMWVLDIKDRKDLHPYFRQYRSHSFIPYTGNSILDQTHPYLSIKDPLSNRHPNGLSFNIFMCGRCFNKIKKTEKKTIEI